MKKISYCTFLILSCCGQAANPPLNVVQSAVAQEPVSVIDPAGSTVETRFNTPAGFKRKPFGANTFENYLRHLPLKPAGTKTRYYDGQIKQPEVCEAVVDMDIGNKNLQQCADAVIRLRAEYFYSEKAYDKISFNLTNGFKADYSEWMKGNRVIVNGNKTWWRKLAEASNTYADFRNYLDLVFSYAGTLSLSKSLHHKDISDISIGDVFIIGGSPGHAVIVVDVAENKTREKIFMLAQSYMPAQEIEILKCNCEGNFSPWYNSANLGFHLETPQWSFSVDQLKTW